MAELEPERTRRSYQTQTLGPASSERELREYYNLEIKTIPELSDILAREEKLLKNEIVINKLKDKGAKLKAKVEAIRKELLLKVRDMAMVQDPVMEGLVAIRKFQLDFKREIVECPVEQECPPPPSAGPGTEEDNTDVLPLVQDIPPVQMDLESRIAGLTLGDPPQQKTTRKQYDEALMTPLLVHPPLKNMDYSESVLSVFKMAADAKKEEERKAAARELLRLPQPVRNSTETLEDRVRVAQFFAKLMHPNIDREVDSDDLDSDDSEESDDDEVE